MTNQNKGERNCQFVGEHYYNSIQKKTNLGTLYTFHSLSYGSIHFILIRSDIYVFDSLKLTCNIQYIRRNIFIWFNKFLNKLSSNSLPSHPVERFSELLPHPLKLFQEILLKNLRVELWDTSLWCKKGFKRLTPWGTEQACWQRVLACSMTR